MSAPHAGFRPLTEADVRRMPWRNGRGVTEELAIEPASADVADSAFLWRASKAGVVEPGPFSAFPGYDRWIVVIDGAGLDLAHGEAAPRVRLGPLQPYRFSGDWATEGEPVGGPIGDFNLLLRRGAIDGDVRVVRAEAGEIVAEVGPGAAIVQMVGGPARRIDGLVDAVRVVFAATPGTVAVVARVFAAREGAGL